MTADAILVAIGHTAPSLSKWDKPHDPTQADAYRAVATDPTKVLVGREFGSSNFGPGTAPAIITAWQPVSSGNVPAVRIGLLIVVTFAASLTATAAPAIQASHIRPADALRIAD